MIIAVDPGTRCTGLATVDPEGKLVTWRLLSDNIDSALRMRMLLAGLKAVFAQIESFGRRADEGTWTLVEEGIFYRSPARQIAMLGELRGMIMGEAWARGWDVRKVSVQWWKAFLSKEERAMKKNKTYVAYFNMTRDLNCSSADEVDAALIHRAATQSGLYR